MAGGGAEIVAGPVRAADQLESWFDEAGIDGFNITDPMPLRSYRDLNAFVLPKMRRRGHVREHYDGTTYRESFYGAGQKRAPDDHPASANRRLVPSSNHVWKTA